MIGCTPFNTAYHLDRVPVREADVAEGHAVRHLYLLDLRIRSNAPPKPIRQEGLLGKLLGIKPQRTVEAMTNWDGALHRSLSSASPQHQDCELTAKSYCAWANRGPGTMRLWLPCL